MKLIKCENNHYFDSDKFISCPHCANQAINAEVSDILGMNQRQINTAVSHSQYRKEYRNVAMGKTVGWLVCIEGTMIGESFVLREGDNYIGRAENMDIPLLYESTVSREKHAVITYDPIQNSCVLYSQKHSDQTLCNRKNIKVKRTLKNRDVITLGDCSLLFVPLCNASFRWSKIETKQ